MRESLFKRVSRHAGGGAGGRDLENKLTETVAAVLERDDILARAFSGALLEQATREARPAAVKRVLECNAWLSAYGDGAEAMIATQVARGSRSIDLEVRLARDPLVRDRDLLIWVEVKHGAPLSGDQLDAYQRLVEEERAEARLVVVVAPRSKPPDLRDVPESIPSCSWQDTLASYSALLPERRRDSAGHVLNSELLAYLTEEDLMPAPPMTPEFAIALNHRTAAHEVVKGLCRVVHDRVNVEFVAQDQKGHGIPQYGIGFWATNSIPAADARWRDGWLEWGFRTDAGRRAPRGVYAFVAGVCFHRDQDPAAEPDAEQWLNARRSEGFERVLDDRSRLVDYLYPEQLLATPTFEGQADRLATWVRDRYRTVSASPPGHVSST